jgi:tetratricopeptide (TPR) repeat protein
MQNVEKYISLAEIAFKSGDFKSAILNARTALCMSPSRNQSVALRVFIAKTLSKTGDFQKSNDLYRQLLREEIYLPPVIMGLIYNNFYVNEKVQNNLKLMKIFVR